MAQASGCREEYQRLKAPFIDAMDAGKGCCYELLDIPPR